MSETNEISIDHEQQRAHITQCVEKITQALTNPVHAETHGAIITNFGVDKLREYADRTHLDANQFLVCSGFTVSVSDHKTDAAIDFTVLVYPCLEQDHYLAKVFDKYTFAYVGVNNELCRVSKEVILRQTYRFKPDDFDAFAQQLPDNLIGWYKQIYRQNV